MCVCLSVCLCLPYSAATSTRNYHNYNYTYGREFVNYHNYNYTYGREFAGLGIVVALPRELTDLGEPEPAKEHGHGIASRRAGRRLVQ